MTSLYAPSALGFLAGDLDAESGVWNVLAVDSSYVYDAAHVNLVDVDAGARIGEVEITGRATELDGSSAVLRADDVLIPTDPGLVVAGLVIYSLGGDEASSLLIAFIDTTEEGAAIGLTTTADGVVVPWSADGVLVIGTT